VGRSRGLRCVIACQDFAQLEEIHGASMVKALISMCGTLLVGQIMQGETAEQLCKAFGTREVERANISSSSASGGAGAGGSTTLSFNRDEVPLYKPSELTSRLGLTEDGLGVIMMLFTGGHAYELRWPMFQMGTVRAPHIPAPWTLGTGMDWTQTAAAMQPSVPEPIPMLPSKDAATEDERESEVVHTNQQAIDTALADGIAVEVPNDQLAGLEGLEHSESEPWGLAPEQQQAQPMNVGPARSVPGLDAKSDARPRTLSPSTPSRSHDVAAREEDQYPKEEIIVQVVAGSTPASGQDHDFDPLFDAAAELAAIRLGLGPVGLAVEIATAFNAAAVSPNASKQQVHMGQASRGASPNAFK